MNHIPVIKDYQLTAYFQELSADSLYPSAGSSAAMTAAHAAALFAMVCRVNLRKIKEDLSTRKDNQDRKIFWEETLHKADQILEQSLALAQEDGFAIKDFMEGVPQGGGKATSIPLDIACCAGEIIALITHAFPKSYAPVQADAECARCLAEGSKKASLTVARYNLPLLSQEERESFTNQITALEQEACSNT
ncbi:MAG: cyclodeaminase/cyclohydrolase family protein [Syntrophaceticus sp.]|nr:cyclodeaminase/cyclohydrolase family protein [Syntrophaceticus sp.]MDD4360089.1 cyclodeaminase/cyclohydrolase family protein [Syntrophaceticus sp.]MDD4783491.1 cyclodeaminase/cyclohydrolase family protein [Syntrophaceticus sp.]